MQYDGRFKDAPWYVKSLNERIVVVGTGGIGSNALYCLTKTIPATYYIVDDDIVVEHNVGTQFFMPKQIGLPKVEAVKNNCIPTAKITEFKKKFSSEYLPIMITALDNMEARKQVYNRWKEESSRELLIDGRLRAGLYEVYAVTPENQIEYEKTLFDDSQVDEGPCTFKQTAYFGMLIGARITHVLVNYLTNKYSEEPICTVPFKIQEFGEPFYFETI